MNSTLPIDRPHLVRIDVLRAVAVLMVFACHSLLRLQWGEVGMRFLECLGMAGVALFFVLSGFCINLSYLNSPSGESLGEFCSRFFYRRFWRIYPAYIFWLLVFWMLQRPSGSIPDLFAHLLLVHNLKWEWLYSINPVYWTLAVEWQFYLVFPLLIMLRAQFGFSSVLWISLVAFASCVALSASGFLDRGGLMRVLPFSMPALLASWVVGVWLAEQFILRKPVRGLALLSGVSMMIAVLACIWNWNYALRFTCLAGAFAWPVQWAASCDRRLAFSERCFVAVGLWSYSIYLSHHPLIGLASYRIRSWIGWNPSEMCWMDVALHAIVSIGVGFLSYHALEMPGVAAGRCIASKWGQVKKSQ